MVNFINELDYDELVQKSLRSVIYYALKIVEEQGLPGDNHFYITFRTDYPGVVISKNLKIQYPENMTIVLQNQFDNLTVRHNNFSVDLTFGGVPQNVTIPYDAITYFADPHAKFGLSFESQNFSAETDMAAPHDSVSSDNNNKGAEVISFDSFRKR